MLPDGFASGDQVVVGTVERLEHVKDQATLIRSLASLVKMDPAIVDKVRVVIVGDGSLKTERVISSRLAFNRYGVDGWRTKDRYSSSVTEHGYFYVAF
ncbi:MAG: hypothetical protein R3B95_10100 [Nitrospirales bacterium]|nr:hypothetical protein [Nitrospirales bacterium]